MSGFSRDTFRSILGGGVPGNQPVGGGYRDSAFENTRGVTRSVLRRSFGNLYNDGLDSSPLQIATRGESKCGSFRAATMAGDVLGSVNAATNVKYGVEHNTVGQNFASLNLNQGSINRNGNASYAGNPRHVYDTSDFVRYRRLKTINQTYNDLTFGGDQNHATQRTWSRLKM